MLIETGSLDPASPLLQTDTTTPDCADREKLRARHHMVQLEHTKIGIWRGDTQIQSWGSKHHFPFYSQHVICLYTQLRRYGWRHDNQQKVSEFRMRVLMAKVEGRAPLWDWRYCCCWLRKYWNFAGKKKIKSNKQSSSENSVLTVLTAIATAPWPGYSLPYKSSFLYSLK